MSSSLMETYIDDCSKMRKETLMPLLVLVTLKHLYKFIRQIN